MRKIDEIYVHCSATKPSQYNVDAAMIRGWHLARGWDDIGYHYVIKRDGHIENGRAVGVIGAHVRGRNKNSIGICLVGGMAEESTHKYKSYEFNYTKAQMDALVLLTNALLVEYPNAKILGHRDAPNAKKACPCFNVEEYLQ